MKALVSILITLHLLFMLTPRTSSQKFKVLKRSRNTRVKNEMKNIGLRLATKQDVEDLPSHVRAALKKDLVQTVQLQDGYLVVDFEGGHRFTSTKENSENVKKLTIKGNEFKMESQYYGYGGWSLASKQDVIDRPSSLKTLLKSTGLMSTSVGLQDAYLTVGRGIYSLTSGSGSSYEWKLYIQGSYSCAIRDGFTHDRYGYGNQVTKYSAEACAAHCKKRKHTHPEENIRAMSFDSTTNKCHCVTTIKAVADTTKQGCYLIPTRLSERCNVVLGKPEGGKQMRESGSRKIAECFDACTRRRKDDPSINAMAVKRDGCYCIRNMKYVSPSKSKDTNTDYYRRQKQTYSAVKTCSLTCDRKNIQYKDERHQFYKTNVPNWRECSEVCRNVTQCHSWTWKVGRCEIYEKGALVEYATVPTVSGARKCGMTKYQERRLLRAQETWLVSHVVLGIAVIVFIILIVAMVLICIMFRRTKS